MTIVAILGPTACGKSAIAEALAREFGAHILSVDSMQVYRGMNIGTAKPTKATRRDIEHHMIDVVGADEELSVAQFQDMGREVLLTTERVVIAGGSGLHFRALVDPLTFPPTDPVLRATLEETPFEQLQQELLAIDLNAPNVLDIHNPRRVIRAIEVWRITATTPSERSDTAEADAVRSFEPELPHISVGMDAGHQTSRRVSERFSEMMAAGFLEEVREMWPKMGRTARQAVGYQHIFAAIDGDVELEVAESEAIRVTNGLAKRQRTFFRKDPRIHWMPWHDQESARIRDVVDYVGRAAGWSS